jgi:carbamoyl-phosphate synthase large subunit
MARIATQLMMDKKLADLKVAPKKITHFGVKESVFPFDKMPEVDPLLGPEMRSTGEVLGMDKSFGLAFYKSQEAAQQTLPVEGTVLMSVTSRDHAAAVNIAKRFADLGFKIKATEGTLACLVEKGISAELVHKLYEGRPNIEDAIKNKEINLVINTPIGRKSQYDDSYIRKSAIKYKVPYITTVAAALAAVKGIADMKKGATTVRSLQSYHKDIK